jgi:hypothetical protein
MNQATLARHPKSDQDTIQIIKDLAGWGVIPAVKLPPAPIKAQQARELVQLVSDQVVFGVSGIRSAGDDDSGDSES